MRATFVLTSAIAIAAVLFAPRDADSFVTFERVVDGRRATNPFSDGLVIQRESVVPVFGTAAPGEVVVVRIAGQFAETIAEEDGAWRADLAPMPAGGPYVLTVEGAANTLTVEDVMIGEVWLAAGQSNMAIDTPRRTVLDQHPEVRTFRKRRWRDRPGAVPFNFAVELSAALEGVTVGILNRAKKGSGRRIHNWVADSAANDPDPVVAPLLEEQRRWGAWYKKVIRPLQPFAVRGVAWWQGEGELRQQTAPPYDYQVLFPAVIRSWRSDWGQASLPFVFVQVQAGGGLQPGTTLSPLPAHPPVEEEEKASVLRQAFVIALEEPDTGMVATIDLQGGVHPPDRDEIARRIALVALGRIYGQPIAYSGPIYSNMTVEGSSLRVHFRDGTADGLRSEGGPLQGFDISADGVTFHWAEAAIEGTSIVLSSPAVQNPAVARYGFAKNPTWANLFNDSGLGAAPFSTLATPGP